MRGGLVTRLSPSGPEKRSFSASDQGISALHIVLNLTLDSLLASRIALLALRFLRAVTHAKGRFQLDFQRFSALLLLA